MKKVLKSVFLTISLLLFAFVMFLRVNSADEVLGPVTVVPEAPQELTPESVPTPTPTPEPEYFTISITGDCTLNSSPNFVNSQVGYAKTMNGDYSYPFKNTVDYFRDDEYTLSNLECNFSDNRNLSSIEWFSFRAPTEWANILIEGGVDFVTTANNHMMDFGQKGADDTYAALESYGIPYGKEGQGQVVTTPGGIKLGIYCDYNKLRPDKNKCTAEIKKLREQGAEFIICAFHWGKELTYNPEEYQVELAHACIDAGADVIYGSHTHCLQPIEEYNGGLILYSMGNWSFGGSTAPSDPDTAIVQLKLRRDYDGTTVLESYDIIPCCCSSDIEGAEKHWQAKQKGLNPTSYYNDYCPTPYPEDSEGYHRALAKIKGEYEGPDGKLNYQSIIYGQ